MELRFAICDLRSRAMLVVTLLCFPLCGFAAPSAEEAKYTETITKRSAQIVKALDLGDQAKADKVQDILVAQYCALNAWHNEIDSKLKGAAKEQASEIRAAIKPIHDAFLAKLGAELTPEQVEIVKDKMTYGKVKVTYDAYVEIVQTLTSEQKEKILAMLKDAREEAIDGGSSEEKSAIFNKYKGRINNYLSSQGIDMKQKTKEWNERRKKPSSQPSS